MSSGVKPKTSLNYTPSKFPGQLEQSPADPQEREPGRAPFDVVVVVHTLYSLVIH